MRLVFGAVTATSIMMYCSGFSSKIPQITLKTVLGFTKSVGGQWIHKWKWMIGHTRTHYLQRSCLPCRLQSTSKWCHDKASKEKMMLLLVLGKWRVGGGRAEGAQKSEGDSITNLETSPCFIFEDSALQIWGREERGRGRKSAVLTWWLW